MRQRRIASEREGGRGDTSHRPPDQHNAVWVAGEAAGEVERSQQISAPAVVGVGIPVRRHHRRTVAGEHAGEGAEGGARIGLHAVP